MVSFGDAELVELVEHLADMLVVRDHHVIVVALAVALALVLCGRVRPEMHGGGVVPEEERRVGPVRLVNEFERALRHLIVDGLHSLFCQRPGVLDCLTALAVGLAVQHAARAEMLLELGVRRIVRVLRLLFGVEVVEIAEEFVEAVHRRQELVLVAEMVLAELAGRVAERLQEFGDGRIFRAQADVRARHADFG